MILGFESLVAIRFLREGRMQTLLIIVGVAAGVAVVAYISALITGLQRNTIEKTLGAQAHITVSALDERVQVVPTLPGTGVSRLEQTQARAQRPRSIDNWQLLLPELDALSALDALASRHDLQLGERRELSGLTHTFSHFQLAIEPWLVQVNAAPAAVAEADWLWYNLATPPRLGLAAPVKKLLERATDELIAGDAR